MRGSAPYGGDPAGLERAAAVEQEQGVGLRGGRETLLLPEVHDLPGGVDHDRDHTHVGGQSEQVPDREPAAVGGGHDPRSRFDLVRSARRSRVAGTP